MKLELIIADASDYEALQDAAIRGFQQEVELYGRGPAIYENKQRLREILPLGIVRKVILDGKVIGLIIVHEKGSGVYHLGGIVLLPEVQNKGIGFEILRKMEASYPDAKLWTLETPYLSFRNHHFYEKCGYKKVGETKPEENGFVLFLYEKQM